MANPKNNQSAASAPAYTVPKGPEVLAPHFTVEQVRKISSKLFKGIEVGKENGVKIAGIVRNIVKKPSPLDLSKEYCEFHGDFRLICESTVYRSIALILPSYPEATLENAYVAQFEQGVAVTSVEFGFILYKKDDSANLKNGRGFTWEVVSIKETCPVKVEDDQILKGMLLTS